MQHSQGAAVLLLAVAFFVPNAAAVLVPDHDFSGTIIAPSAGDAEGAQRLSLLTGRIDVSGKENGAFSASGTTGAQVTGIGRLEVFRLALGKPAGLPQVFTGAELDVSDNATFVYFMGAATHTFVVHSDFAMVVPLDPPNDFKDLKFESNTSLALVGGSHLVANMSTPGEVVLVASTKNVTFTVVAADGKGATFEGPEWSIRMTKSARLTLDAKSLLVPFSGESTALVVPGDLATARQRFDVNQLAAAYQQAAPDTTAQPPKIDPGLAAQFRDGVAIFDGVMLGQPRGTTRVGGVERPLQGFMLYRFDAVALKPGTERGAVQFEGRGPFLLSGDALYTTKTAVGPSGLSIPVVSLLLWLLAGGALLIGRFVQPFVPPSPVLAALPLRLSGILARVAAAIAVFVLWDIETKHFLGTSLLTLLSGGGSSQGVAFGAVLGVELISLSLALFYFGLPIRFIVNTALKLGQLKRARGWGKGVGYLAAWGLGAAHFALLLNPFIGLFVDSLGKFP